MYVLVDTHHQSDAWKGENHMKATIKSKWNPIASTTLQEQDDSRWIGVLQSISCNITGVTIFLTRN